MKGCDRAGEEKRGGEKSWTETRRGFKAFRTCAREPVHKKRAKPQWCSAALFWAVGLAEHAEVFILENCLFCQPKTRVFMSVPQSVLKTMPFADSLFVDYHGQGRARRIVEMTWWRIQPSMNYSVSSFNHVSIGFGTYQVLRQARLCKVQFSTNNT